MPLAGPRRVGGARVIWGQSWPPAPEPNVPPPPGPVEPRRATDYAVLGSLDGHHWQTLATVSQRTVGTVDELRFAPTRVRFLRLEATAASEGEAPLLEELTAVESTEDHHGGHHHRHHGRDHHHGRHHHRHR